MSDGIRARLPHLLAQLDAAKAEVDRLRAVVDKLPKTADGVPVVPGMTVFVMHTDDGPGRPCDPFVVTYRGKMELTERCALVRNMNPERAMWSDCYSTREAAEAARMPGTGEVAK